jgi:hypothetical protein
MDEREQLCFQFERSVRTAAVAPSPTVVRDAGVAPVVSLSQRRVELVLTKLKALNAAILARANHLPSSAPSTDTSADNE